MRHALLPVLALLAACAGRPQLEPAPEAAVVPGPGAAAAAVDAGVRVIAATQAWSGHPRRLTAFTPMLVTLENRSTRSLLVRYDAFELRAADGEVFAVVPPLQIRGSEIEPVDVAYHPSRRFYVSPLHAPYYPAYDPWDGPWAWRPTFHDVSHVRVALPTADMIHRALPEGVLQPGGRITGYLYLRRVETDAGRLVFEVDLLDARTGEPFGAVEIPFVMDGDEALLAAAQPIGAAGQFVTGATLASK